MKRILTLVFCLFVLLYAQAQQKTVSGVVRDSKGEPVPFATVLEAATKKAVQTDQNGRFSIRTNDGAQLTITSTGYAPQTITANEGMTVTLVSNSNNLNEVVVTALGIRRQPKELGYSVTKVSGEDAGKAKPINVQNGLTGKVSGLNIQTTNNGVFSDTRITLRGIRSLTGNNQALLVIDGSPMPLSLISTLNPNDVQDLTVLKGNTGAALYGQEGGNGVIIITTKSGNRSKPIISIGTTIQRESISFLPKFQREYGNGESENADGTPHMDPWTNNSFGPRYDGSEVNLGDPLEDGSQKRVRYAAQSKTPAEQFFRPAITFQNDISISGGDEKSRYYLSFQDVKVNGLIPKDENRRTTIRLNASREFGKLSTAFRMSYTQGNYNIVNQDRGPANSIYRLLFKTAAHVPISEFEDWRNDKFSTATGYYNRFGWNPYMMIDIDRNKGRSDDLVATLEASYKIMDGFNFTYRLGTNVSFSNNKSVLGAINVSKYTTDLKGIQSARASVADAMGFAYRLNSEAFVTYKKQIDRFTVDGLVGYSLIQRMRKQLYSRGNNLIIPTLYNISNRSGEATVSQENSEIRTTALFGKLSFGWDDWAFLEVTGRNEWDSRLNLNKNSFFYPGGSLSLLLHEVIPQIKTTPISYLKLRGAWALSGTVNLQPYSLESTFSSGTGFPYGSLAGYSANNTINNPDIKPEFVNGKELGIEIGFNNNKIMLEATAFRQDNTDQIIEVATSGSTGYQSALVNAASFVNKGLELDLRLTPLIQAGKDFRMDLKANYTYSDNEVTSIYEGLTELGTSNLNYAIVGMPAFVLKLKDFNRTPEGKVIVDRETGLPTSDPVTKAYGRTLPKHLIGINPSFKYKDFSLSIVADYRGGHYVFNGIGGDLIFEGSGALTTKYDRKPFVFPNSVYDDGTGKYVENTNVLTNGGTATFWTASVFQDVQTMYYNSAASWKLREVSLSYELPVSILQHTRFIKSALITVSGRNLFTWVPASNIYTDPEFSNTTGNSQGVNNSFNTPPTRIFGASINLTF